MVVLGRYSEGQFMRDETKCLRAGYTPGNAEPRVLPIAQSTAYVYDSAEEVGQYLMPL